ncbi:MAG: hypothetical protein ACRD3S_08960, partial [Terracidiphilus sp.]
MSGEGPSDMNPSNMNPSEMKSMRGIRLRLPATSANLGPGFDAVAVALDFVLEIDAEPAQE